MSDFLQYHSGCTSELLAAFSSNNNIPLCDGEIADLTKFFSGLVDDGGSDAVTTQDIAATYTEFYGPPGKYR